MSSLSRYESILLKVGRAKHHISDLEKRRDAFLADEPYRIGAKPHPIPEIEHTRLYVESVKPVPTDIPLILGDAIHNLRAALDHAAWQLVEAGGGIPSKDTYFPIGDALHEYQSAIGNGERQKIAPGALSIKAFGCCLPIGGCRISCKYIS